jgi:undecaprenyl-diphosphatase
VLAGEVLEGETMAFDSAILRAFRNPADPGDPIGPPIVEAAVRDVTALGSDTIIFLLIGIISGFLALKGQKRLALLIVGAVAGGAVFSVILKEVFQRSRPDLVPHAVTVYSPSFPSGHAMVSATAYLTLGALLARSVKEKVLKAYVLGAAVTLTILIGITRVYLGVHWPTDVLAGWTAGSVWAIICSNLARRLQLEGKIEPEAVALAEPRQ